jgi:hypothetical protein
MMHIVRLLAREFVKCLVDFILYFWSPKHKVISPLFDSLLNLNTNEHKTILLINDNVLELN